MRKSIRDTPEVRAALLASSWARSIGLRPGNLWEPAIVRNMLCEYARLGSDANAWAFIEATYRLRLGLSRGVGDSQT